MKYDYEEAFLEIVRRCKSIKQKKERNKLWVLSLTSSAIGCLILSLLVMTGASPDTDVIQSRYGAFLISPQTGGYILVGIIGFVLGSALVIYCWKYKQRLHKNKTEKPDCD